MSGYCVDVSRMRSHADMAREHAMLSRSLFIFRPPARIGDMEDASCIVHLGTESICSNPLSYGDAQWYTANDWTLNFYPERTLPVRKKITKFVVIYLYIIRKPTAMEAYLDRC